MSCHRRCTFAFVTIHTVITIAILLVELFTPNLYEGKSTSQGLLYKCSDVSRPADLLKQVQSGICQIQFRMDATTICGVIALGLVVIFFISSLIVWMRLCCTADHWPLFFVVFVQIGIGLMVLALISNIIATYFAVTQRPADSLLAYSFYALCIADGLCMVTIVMLIAILCCRQHKDDDASTSQLYDQKRSPHMPQTSIHPGEQLASLPQHNSLNGPSTGYNKAFPSNIGDGNGDTPIYRNLYSFTQSTVFDSKR